MRNLALVYAEAGLRVAVIEADLRRPTLARLFAVNSEPGLTDVLMGLTSLGDVLQDVPAHFRSTPSRDEHSVARGPAIGGCRRPPGRRTNGDGEDGSGTAAPHRERTASPPTRRRCSLHRRCAALVDRVAEHHDIVLIDSPPLLAVSDAVPLMSLADGDGPRLPRSATSTEDGAAADDDPHQPHPRRCASSASSSTTSRRASVSATAATSRR